MATKFVPEELVLTIHADLLQRYGGEPGLRDRGLLESALAQPKMTFSGKEVHKTVFDKAAAYGFTFAAITLSSMVISESPSS